MLHQTTRRYAVLCVIALSMFRASAEDADEDEAIKDDAVEVGVPEDESAAAGATTARAAAHNANVVYLYGGGNIGGANQGLIVVLDDYEDDDSSSFLFSYGRFGMEFNELISGEIRLGSAAAWEEVETDDLETMLLIGGYIRVGIPMDAPLYPYGVIGLTYGDLTVETAYAFESFSDSGVSFGVGVDLKGNYIPSYLNQLHLPAWTGRSSPFPLI